MTDHHQEDYEQLEEQERDRLEVLFDAMRKDGEIQYD